MAQFVIEKALRSAPGIPNRDRFVPIPRVTGMWEYGIHEHDAERSGHHFDVRLGYGPHAHSWALRRLPEPGEKVLAVQQPTHDIRYMDFSGQIPAGYGKGRVQLHTRDKVRVLEAAPGKLKFVRYKGKEADEFTLVRTQERKWLLVNQTTYPGKYDFPQWKPSYATVPFDDSLADQDGIMTPKVDGAQGLAVLQAGKMPRVFSVRLPSTGGVIEWTHKMPQLWNARVPKGVNQVLRTEVFLADKKGNPLPAEVTAGVLNSNILTAIASQNGTGGLQIMPFQIFRKAGETPKYEQDLEELQGLSKKLSFLRAMPYARTREEKLKLLQQIRAGEHPLTNEGVVVWRDQPYKAKLIREADVYPTEAFVGQGKYSKMAGGFSFSRQPGGLAVGKVGSGFSDALRQEIWLNRAKLARRVATVAYLKDMPSGALFGPRFMRWHPDKDPGGWD